jgi:hypothetical protein
MRRIRNGNTAADPAAGYAFRPSARALSPPDTASTWTRSGRRRLSRPATTHPASGRQGPTSRSAGRRSTGPPRSSRLAWRSTLAPRIFKNGRRSRPESPARPDRCSTGGNRRKQWRWSSPQCFARGLRAAYGSPDAAGQALLRAGRPRGPPACGRHPGALAGAARAPTGRGSRWLAERRAPRGRWRALRRWVRSCGAPRASSRTSPPGRRPPRPPGSAPRRPASSCTASARGLQPCAFTSATSSTTLVLAALIGDRGSSESANP